MMLIFLQVAFIARKGFPQSAEYKVGGYDGSSVEISTLAHGSYGNILLRHVNAQSYERIFACHSAIDA